MVLFAYLEIHDLSGAYTTDGSTHLELVVVVVLTPKASHVLGPTMPS
jgi:hypothetical protein